MSRKHLERLASGIALCAIVGFVLFCVVLAGKVLYQVYTHAPVVLVVAMVFIVLSYLAGIANDRYDLLDRIDDWLGRLLGME